MTGLGYRLSLGLRRWPPKTDGSSSRRIHRGPLRRSLEKASGGPLAAGALSELKVDIARALAPAASAVLLDPETGVDVLKAEFPVK